MPQTQVAVKHSDPPSHPDVSNDDSVTMALASHLRHLLAYMHGIICLRARALQDWSTSRATRSASARRSATDAERTALTDYDLRIRCDEVGPLRRHE